MRTRFALLDPVVMNRSNPVPPGAFAHACSFVRHAVSNALAAAALLSPGIGGAAPTCADVLKSIEKRLADAGVRHPPLKIVPKGLASGYRVVGTCEGGTQRIVHDIEPPPSQNDAGKAKTRAKSASSQ